MSPDDAAARPDAEVERLEALRRELARSQAALARSQAALAKEREALAADRRALAREWAVLRAQQAAAARDLRASAVQPTSTRSASRWTEQDGGAFVCRVGAALTRGEHELLRLGWPDGWLLASGVEVADRNRTREIDLLVIAPQGVVVVEQKDTAARGTLHFSANGPPMVDGAALPQLGGALRQARLPAQMIAASSREAGIRVGYVQSVLTLRGRVRVEPPQVGGVHLCAFDEVRQRIHDMLGPSDEESALQVGTVLALLSSLGLPLIGLPALQELGFPDSSW